MVMVGHSDLESYSASLNVKQRESKLFKHKLKSGLIARTN
jgi:hypothetical protein